MKSDREFLDGVYETIKRMKHDKVTEEIHRKEAKGITNWQFSTLKLVSSLGAVLLLITLVVNNQSFLQLFEASKTPQVVNSRNNNSINRSIEEATEIVEVTRIESKGKLNYTITALFKGEFSTQQQVDLINSLVKDGFDAQKAVLFLDSNRKDGLIVDAFFWNDNEKVFVNSFGETISSTSLLNIDNK